VKRAHGAALLIALGSLFIAERAGAYEREWHVGMGAGYSLATFPVGTANGFDAGVHATYGVSDAFNLRLHSDVSAFDLPNPHTSAVLFGAGFGAEYVFDILQWVPYVGATVGPSATFIQGGPKLVRLGIELPAGLGYKINRSFTVGFEARYRLMLLGDGEVGPSNGLVAIARAEYAWGS
jgi:hypothetical protein